MKAVIINENSKHYSITGIVVKRYINIFLKPKIKIKLCTGETVTMKPTELEIYE